MKALGMWLKRSNRKPNGRLLPLVASAAVFVGLVLVSPNFLCAKVTGECYFCHTMHNSQGGATMNGQATPMTELLKVSCLGCHAMNTANKIETLAGQNVPQVRHTDASGDLAGGNFAYMLGGKGSGASDAKGHNVVDFGNYEDTAGLYYPPGMTLFGHTYVNADRITCASVYGCHGRRHWTTEVAPMQGTHHRDVDGQLDTADRDYNSYRFLWGVKGLEASNWQNVDASNHNEYFGFIMPNGYNYDCSTRDCHYDGGGDPTLRTIRPPNNTMSGFCATCHPNFHQVAGIGGDVTAPFTRHPTDVLLPTTGEYAAYTLYNTTAPVARTSVPASPNSVVQPGTDVVMCLSCHVAHASDYNDLLRWDYSTIISGGGSNNNGCFVCHTKKDTNN